MSNTVITTEEGLNERIKELYLVLMKREGDKDRNKVINLCQQKLQLNNLNNQQIVLYQLPLVTTDYPLTASNDTVLHVATYLGQNKLVKELLGLIREDPDLVKFPNATGDTVLHEATTIDKIEVEVVDTMIGLKIDVLDARNLKGETPLFRAVHFGNATMYRHLLQRIEDPRGHWIRNDDGANILHIAIMTESYDLALEIAEKYPELLDKRDQNGMTGLQLLSRTPSAFKSGAKHHLMRKCIYFCVPIASQSNGSNQTHPTNVLGKINQLIWSRCLQACPWTDGIWNEKKKHESARKLAEYLIQHDLSWKESDPGGDPGRIDLTFSGHHEHEDHPDDQDHRLDLMDPELFHEKEKEPPETPLFIATSNGIVEIFKKILEEFPQAVEHVGSNGQNILHVAIKNRRQDIFVLFEKMKLPMLRLARRIDKKGNTALHQVEFSDAYKGEQPSPAIQLGEELYWFKQVKEVLPTHYQMHRNKEGLTADDLFKKSHSKLLMKAQEWLKSTSESCSIVAVLIASVAFAAAYTVPGGSNKKGEPILLNKPFFVVFTVMDVVSLASSLTSVVMFLSILTSSFQFKDFKQSLPRRLILGFTFLFISVATMMLAFAATIILTTQTEKRSAKLLIYIIAFLPVSIFACLQFPLYMALTATAKYTARIIKKTLPTCNYCTSKKDQ